jgi:hypothetical protein
VDICLNVSHLVGMRHYSNNVRGRRQHQLLQSSARRRVAVLTRPLGQPLPQAPNARVQSKSGDLLSKETTP